MKYESTLNLFWTIVWAVVLIETILGFFWPVALYFVAIIAAIMFGVFLSEYVRFKRMK